MFTSQPSLAQSVERMIQDTPVVDPRTRLRCDQPSAPDLASLIGGHGVPCELRAAGRPAVDSDPGLPADEIVRRAIPYLRRTRNTATSWCLYRIFRDLYDFHDPYLTESNYRDLLDKVATTGRDPAWARYVLRDRCNIRTAVTGYLDLGADPSNAPVNVLFSLDVDGISLAGVADRTRKRLYFESLSSLFGDRPSTTERLTRLLHDWLDLTLTGPVRFTRTSLTAGQSLLPPDESHAQFVLTQVSDDWEVNDADTDALTRFVTWQVLAWHHDHRKAVQLFVGAEDVLVDGPRAQRSQESWSIEMARTFREFGGARFDLLVGSESSAHEVAALARQCPNVYASGYGWPGVVPGAIESIYGHRVHTAPMNKFSGFFSDAPYAEWIYGTFQVVKKSMASTLARLVETGYFEEDEVPPVLHQTLHDTPIDLYGLSPR